jgi:hypothetical protein
MAAASLRNGAKCASTLARAGVKSENVAKMSGEKKMAMAAASVAAMAAKTAMK